MRRPPTLPDLVRSPLLSDFGNGVDLTITDCGAHTDCWDCQFYDVGPEADGGEHCAMEAAAIIGIVTPELARLFGWIERESGWFGAPARCPWFAAKDAPAVPFDDPAQLDMLKPLTCEAVA